MARSGPVLATVTAPAPSGRREGYRGRMPSWGAAAFYILCACVLFWPVLSNAGTGLPQDLGDPPMQAWIIGWDVHALLDAPARLWDANVFYPAHDVLAYQDNLLALAPVAVPLLLLSHNLLLTYNMLFLLSFASCGWFCFLFARYLLQQAGIAERDALPAALLAGLIYAFLPFKMAHLGHLNLLSAEPLPLIFLFWERGWRGGRWPTWVALAVAFVAQALCSLHYAVYAGLGLVFLLVLRLRGGGWRQAPWRALLLTLVGTCAALAPIALPYARVIATLGGQRPLGEVVALAPDLRDLLHSSPQSLLYGWTDRLFPPYTPFAPQYLFPGVVPLLLALIGWRAARRGGRERGRSFAAPPLRPYGFMGLGAVVLALGPFLRVGGAATPIPLPYLVVYWIVPGVRGLRDPGRFAIVAGLCLALLAAWGAATVVRQRRLLWPLLWGIVVLEYAAGPVPMPHVATAGGVPAVYRWLAVQGGAGAVLELPIGISTLTLWSAQTMMMYYSTYHWKQIVNGAPGFVPRDYDRLLAVWRSFPSAASVRLLQARGVRYVIVHGADVGAAVAAHIATQAAARGVEAAGRWGTDVVYRLY